MAEFALQYCALVGPCCQTVGAQANEATCRGQVESNYAGRFDGRAGDTCLADLRAATAHSNFCAEDLADTPSCAILEVRGSKQPGEECNTDAACAPSTEGHVACAFSSDSRKQVCEIQLVGALGATPCVGYMEGRRRELNDDIKPARAYLCDRAQGLRCDGASKTCVALSNVGGTCVRDGDCENSASCNAGRCVARAAVGSHCDRVTNAIKCDLDAYCNPDTSKCAPLLSVGEPCSNGISCGAGRCISGKCQQGGSYLTLGFLCGH
ncbi:hypothetical protein LVJ94_06100 [Pendulispora rubella]|uniref:Dickkopf N-terminal cysteine-rich domain-containing protein n=1 Tax=Pendulispora rubella TaxID=2741070 RepID=A0ABZ2L797_9BACT